MHPLLLLAICSSSACLERTTSGHVWLSDRSEGSGLVHQRALAAGYSTLSDRMMGGVCVLDLDGVAPLDLFFAGRLGGTRLYRGSLALGFVRYDDVTERMDVSDVDATGCVAADLDGDARTDLAVSTAGGAFLFLNRGGTFTRAALLPEAPGFIFSSIAAGDLDGDLDVDLVVGGFVDERGAPTSECDTGLPCGIRIQDIPPIANVLLLREGDGFVDRTSTWAPDLLVPEPTLAVAVVDLDGDGRPEIVIGNDLGGRYHDRVLVREGDHFVDRALERGLATNNSGHGIDTMGLAFGDVDGSGTLDVAESDFEGWHTALFVCGADGFCEERGRVSGLLRTESSLRWGNALLDLDLDGDLELFEATGHVYLESEGLSIGRSSMHAQAPNLHEGIEGGFFARVIPEAGSALERTYEARGIAVLDVDDDGALDVILSTTRGRPALLANVRERVGHWLRVVLVGRPPNTDAIGARVVVSSATGSALRVRLAGEGYLGSFDPRLHFGVPHAGPVTVRVTWPDGTRTELWVDGTDREVVVREPR